MSEWAAAHHVSCDSPADCHQYDNFVAFKFYLYMLIQQHFLYLYLDFLIFIMEIFYYFNNF